MADILDDWASSGLKPVTLPSGFEVRLRLPEPRDLIVRGLLPVELVQAVMAAEAAGGLADVSASDPALAQQLVESMQILAADSIRQVRKGSEVWRPITVTVERYAMLPEPDRELIEGLITGTLGETVDDTTDEAKRAGRQEAAATVDGYRDFRDGGPRPARRKGRGAVEHPPVDPDRSPAADGGARDRPRTRRASRKG